MAPWVSSDDDMGCGSSPLENAMAFSLLAVCKKGVGRLGVGPDLLPLEGEEEEDPLVVGGLVVLLLLALGGGWMAWCQREWLRGAFPCLLVRL